MATDTTLLIDAFNDSKESWKKDHEELKYCWALEDKIREGLGLFHTIQMSDVRWSKAVQSGKTHFDAGVARALHECYVWWLGPCDQVLGALSAIQKLYKVEQAEAFVDCVRIATKRASVDIEQLIRSVEQKNRGEMVTITEEIWNEIVATDVAGRAA